MLRRLLLPILAIVLAWPAAAVAAAAIQSDGGTILEGTGPDGRLIFPDGKTRQIALPARAEVTGLADVGRQWLASGTTADADGVRRLWLRLGDRRAARDLPAPPPSPLAIQRRPVPLIEGGELVGLAWLEGVAAGGLGVRAAAWSGTEWSAPEWVARPGAGSQTALVGAVLADGTWLLVWSAFDGRDDEIVFARRARGGWEAPRRIAAGNDVPDITPAVAPTRGGAIAAWDRYRAGAYVLVRAAFDGEAWRELPGTERGGLYPVLRGGGDSPTLLFFAARRAGWTALALDDGGAIVRRAEAPGPSTDEPPLVVHDGDGVRLRSTAAGEEFRGQWRTPR